MIGRPLDATDWRILEILQVDGRIPNKQLASRVGIAPSTCVARVAALRADGVLRGFGASVDLAALGRPVQAVVGVQLRAHDRQTLTRFRDAAAAIPLVRHVYHLTGAADFLLLVAAPDMAAVRGVVVDRLSARPEVLQTLTQVVLDDVPGAGAVVRG